MEGITTLLRGLKLERIQLTVTRRHGLIHWHLLPIAFHTAFLACISTPYMKEICIDAIPYFPLTQFADCAGLRHLKSCDSALPSNGSFKFPQLETLELSDWAVGGHSHDFFSWLLTHACGLRFLMFTTSIESVIRTFLPRLLAICATSLVNLSIYFINSKPIYPVTRVVVTLLHYSKLWCCYRHRFP